MNKILLLGITIALSILLVVSMAYGTSQNKFGDCKPLDQSCNKLNHVIKQNDWLICAELHKGSHMYYNSDGWSKKLDHETAYNMDDLKKICGEIP
mgnify:CR=1 FL=1